MWKEKFFKAFRDNYDRKKQKNHRFSYRAYAKQTGLSIASISDIMTGSSSISRERAIEVIPKLRLPVKEKNQLLAVLGQIEEVPREIFPEDDFEFITDWRNLAVLFLFDLAEVPDSKQIAERLKISPSQVEDIIKNLLAKELIKKIDGKFVKTQKHFMSGDNPIPSEVVAKSHLNGLEVNRLALNEVPPFERDFTSMTFAGSKSDIELARKEIRDLYSKIIALMGSPPHDEVYRLSVALFPINFAGEK